MFAVPALVSWARSASIGVRWGSVVSSSGNRGLPIGLLGRGAGVRDCCCALSECWVSGTWSMRANLGEGLKDFLFGAARVVIAVAGRSRSWVFWVRCWVGCVGDGSGGVSAFGWPRVVGVWDVAVAAAAAV